MIEDMLCLVVNRDGRYTNPFHIRFDIIVMNVVILRPHPHPLRQNQDIEVGFHRFDL
jgi:hypothetical protein